MPTESGPIAPFISDLRRAFYGGTATEYAAVQDAAAQGITLSTLVQTAAGQGAAQSADLDAKVATHNTDGAAHGLVIRWKTAGKEGHGIYMQSATPPADPGSLWVVI